MSSLPKISIVTPSFNQGHFIEETIDSVLSQQYGNLEYIIIDGGSKDQTVKIIKKYEKHLTYWVSEKDQGQSDAINKGLEKCTGVVFNWLNSDDLLVPGALTLIGESFKNEAIDLFSGWEIHFGSGAEEIKHGSIIYPELEMNLLSGVIYQPSTFWRMEVLRGVLPLRTELHYLMDTDLWIRYILSHGIDKIKKVDEPLAKFRLHPDSKSILFQERFLQERWLLRQRLFKGLALRPEHWLESLPDSPLSKEYTADLQVSDLIDPNVYRQLFAEELAYFLYEKSEYGKLRSLLQSVAAERIITRKLFQYLWRVLLPNPLLNYLRG